MDRNRRQGREGDCSDEQKPLISTSAAPVRPTPACDPPEQPITPVMRPPSSAQPVPPAPRRPDTLQIGNDEITVTCADDYPGSEEGPPFPTGANVVVAAATLTLPFRLQSIEGITVGKMDYIAGLQDSDPASILTTLAAGAATIASTFLVPLSVATDIYDAYMVVKNQVNESATAEALTQLQCVWGNEETTVSCEGERPSDGDAIDGPTNPITIAADTFFSPVSQDEANRRARDAALLQLICNYESDEVTVLCGDLDVNWADLNPGQPNEETGGILGDETPQAPGPVWPGSPGRFRINKVTLPVGSYVSPVSKDDANFLADAAAKAILDCFYRNAADPGGPSCAGTEGPVGDWETGTPGVSVAVPAGIAASTISWEAAAEAAAAMVTGLLYCVCVSAPVEVDCTDLEVDLLLYSQLAGEEILLTLNQALSPVYSVSLPAGTVILPSDLAGCQDAANAQAEQIALSMLECTYCGPAIPGRCPLSSADNRPPILASTFSVDRTLGVEADQICGSSPFEVISQIDSVGLTPVLPDPDPNPEAQICSYGNTDLLISCDGAVPLSLNLTVWRGKADTYNKWDVESVTIAKESYFASSLEAADDLAIQVASVILNCRYAETANVCCPSNPCRRGDFRLRDTFGFPVVDWPRPPLWRIIVEAGPGPVPPPEETFTDACNPEEHGGVDPEETFTYIVVDVPPCNSAEGESYISLEDAANVARAAALGALECPYTNYPRGSSSSCGGGQAQLAGESYYVPEGTYVSEWGSTATANMMAEQAVSANSICYPVIGGSINMTFGGVQGGTAKAGLICGMDCDIKPGTLIPFEELADDLVGPACFVLKLTCGAQGEPKVEIIKVADRPAMEALVNSKDGVYVPLGCVTDEGVIEQEAFGMPQIDWCEELETEVPSHPFKLLYDDSDQQNPPNWYVEPILSTIIDGTDGPLIPIDFLAQKRWDSAHVSVEVLIAARQPVSAQVVLGKYPEVVMTNGEQIAAYLYIGRVDADQDGIHFTFKQATNDAQILTYGFNQGSIVRVFAPAPTNADVLDPL